MKLLSVPFTSLAAAVVALCVSAPTASAQSGMGMNTDAPPILYTGAAVRDSAKSRPVRITLERWSTQAERNEVVSAFASDKSPAELAETLSEMEAIGSFRTISGQSNPIRYARESEGADGTRRLVLVTDDQIQFWQGASAPGTLDQAYTLIEVHFGGETDGEGKVTHEGAEVDVSQGRLMISDYADKPVGLIGVQKLGDDAPM